MNSIRTSLILSLSLGSTSLALTARAEGAGAGSTAEPTAATKPSSAAEPSTVATPATPAANAPAVVEPPAPAAAETAAEAGPVEPPAPASAEAPPSEDALSEAPARGSIQLRPQAEDEPSPTRDRGYDGPPTLSSSHHVSLGGYLGFTTDYTRMFGRNGAVVGLEGGLLLGHRLGIGVAAHGWTNSAPAPQDASGNPRRYESAYVGAAVHYSLINNSPVYVSLGTLVGGGAVVLAPDLSDHDRDGDSSEVGRDEVDRYFVLQPEVEVSTNVTRWMRVSVNGGYRFVAGIHKFGFDNGDIGGPVVGGKLQFGWL